MKKLLILPLLLLLLMSGCKASEEERNTLMENARKLEQSERYGEARDEAGKAVALDAKFTEGYLLMGRCDLEEQNLAAALANFTKALELDPKNFEATQNISRIALLNGDLPKAEEFLNKAAALDEKSLDVTVIRANLLMRKREFAKAIPALEEAVKSNALNEEVVVALASAYLNTGEAAKARALLADTVKNKPDASAVLSLLISIAIQEQDFPAAEDYLKRLQQKHPENEHLVIQLADLYSITEKSDLSLETLVKYLESYPGADIVRIRLSDMSVARGEFDKALEIIDKAPEATAMLRYHRAAILTQAGRVDEAVPVLRALADDTQAGETSVAARFALAEINIQKEQFDDAANELGVLIKKDPENARAVFLRGRVYFTQKKYDLALADLEKVVQLAPNDLPARLALSDVQLAAGKPEAAEASIKEVIAKDPKFAQAYLTLVNFYLERNNLDAALQALSGGKEANPENGELPVIEADILTQLKRYDEAEAVLTKLAEDENFAPAALLRLAGVYSAKGDYSKAVSTYDKVLELNPEAVNAVEGRVRALLGAGKSKEALAYAEKRQKDRPEDPTAAYIVGEVALINKDDAKAEKSFQRALALAPQWEQPLTRLVQFYSERKRLDDAIKLCREISGKNTEATGAAVILAILFEEKGEFKNAEDAYRNVLIKHPEHLLAANNLAYLLVRYKPAPERLKEAEELAARATQTGAPAPYDTLGWVQHLRGNNGEAEKNLRKAHEGFKENSSIAYHLAVVLAAGGDAAKKEEAVGLLKEINARNAPFPEKSDAEKLLKSLE